MSNTTLFSDKENISMFIMPAQGTTAAARCHYLAHYSLVLQEITGPDRQP